MEMKTRLNVGKTATQRLGRRHHKKRKSLASGLQAERLAALESKAFYWIARGRAANVEFGRVLRQIKTIVGHGRWQRYYRERFGLSGIPLRTAQAYMELARKEHEICKSAESALFPRAADMQAVATRAATEHAKAEVGGATRKKPSKEKVQLDGPNLYKLSLHLKDDEINACESLQKLPEWPRAEQKIIDLLKDLCVDFDIVSRGFWKASE